MRNTTAAKSAKGKCDKLFSLIVRSRGRCEYCGEKDYPKLQTAHIISRRFSTVRTDERNAYCLCARCHSYFTDRPVGFGIFVLDRMGGAAYAELQSRARAVTKMDWHAEAERLAQRWAEIKAAA